jgi:hypothetical protein
MTIEAPNPIDEDPGAHLLGAARPGETDEQVRDRHDKYLELKDKRRGEEPLSAEEEELNRQMFERYRDGGFSDPNA